MTILKPKDVETLIQMAHAQTRFSMCLKKKVGAALYSTTDRAIYGLGHGGPKIPCKECVRKKYEWTQDGCWSIHAEIRAIFDYFKKEGYNNPFISCVMFTTHGPCDGCLKYMNYFGIGSVVYDIPYHNDYSKWVGKIRVFSKEEYLKNCYDIDEPWEPKE